MSSARIRNVLWNGLYRAGCRCRGSEYHERTGPEDTAPIKTAELHFLCPKNSLSFPSWKRTKISVRGFCPFYPAGKSNGGKFWTEKVLYFIWDSCQDAYGHGTPGLPSYPVSLPIAMAAIAATSSPGASLSLNQLLPKGSVWKTEKELEEDPGSSCVFETEKLQVEQQQRLPGSHVRLSGGMPTSLPPIPGKI